VRKSILLRLLAASFLLIAVDASPQALRGLVHDPAGNPVPQAQVTAHSTEADRTATTAADGAFQFENLPAATYQLKAEKPGYAASQLVAATPDGPPVTLTLGPRTTFLHRLAHAYAADWHPSPPDPNAPEPPRRAIPSPLDSPPFPNSDWSYGGSPTIGVPDTNVPPLMEALYEGPHGDAWQKSRVKIYGWLEASVNGSTSSNSNAPAVYDIFANRAELDQAVLYIERIPDSVQTDHIDWGFHVSGLYGTSYRFTTNLGYFSQQLLQDHRQYGFDPVLEYFDLYIPNVAAGLNIRIGRFISVPGIEAQLAPNNYVYTHSMLYSIDPFTDTGIIGTLKLNDRWLIQLGLTASHDVAPWSHAARPAATACVSYTFNSANDNTYTCINGINTGTYGYNNLQMFDNTWYHKFNKSWHMATETYYMYQRNVPAVDGPIAPELGSNGAFCSPGEIRCFAPEWAAVNYIEREVNSKNNFTIRTDFLDDMKGQRTGIKNRYTELTLMWGHWIGSTILFRPELRYDRAVDRPAFDFGRRKDQFQFAMDVIFKF